MELLKFLFVLIIAYQISSLIAESSFPVFSYLRQLPHFFGNLFSCVLCVSVWLGWFSAGFLYDPAAAIGFTPMFLPTWFWSGFVYSCLVWFVHLFEGKLAFHG
jgi:hypothetical protein